MPARKHRHDRLVEAPEAPCPPQSRSEIVAKQCPEDLTIISAESGRMKRESIEASTKISDVKLEITPHS